MQEPSSGTWARLLQHDSQGMLGDLEAFAAQCRAAVQIAASAALPTLPEPPRAILALGLGGSAIGGDLLAAALAGQADQPILVHRNYGLPAWVGPATLVLAVSYSGNTEETLDAYRTAVSRGAPVVAVTSGGTLAQAVETAASEGAPTALIRIPSGLQPRAATGHLFLPLLVSLHRLGLIDPPEASLAEAFTVLDQLVERLRWRDEPNPAQQLARELADRPVYIYGADGIGAVAAYRWQTQLNENAKVLVHAHHIPELNHNEIVGWQSVPADVAADPQPAVIFLRHEAGHPRNRFRLDFTRELLEPRADCHQVHVESRDPLATLLGLCYWGDLVSFYLALLREEDPSSIEHIVLLKERLAAHPR